MTILSETPADWWKSAVIYQIYPRSFYDADNNGIGDLQGITRKLDYLNDGNGGGLGIDAVWLSPFFTSPMLDFGYDVSNYCDVDPIFGNLADFKQLVDQAHRRGIKVIIDLVLNHCSDQHPWFEESRKDKTNPKEDWFIWQDPQNDGSCPNNWLSVFGGSAWEYDQKREQYYYHSFLKEQPDLNWYHPEVRKQITTIIQFWLNLGVDGFRLDTANFFAYDQQLRDNPKYPDDLVPLEPRSGIEYDRYDTCYSKDRPENLEFLNLIRTTIEAHSPHITTIGEIGGIQELEPLLKLSSSYVQGKDHLHMAYTFSLLGSQINAKRIAEIITETEKHIADGWPCWSFGNHDCTRVRTRCENLGFDPEFSQNLMLLLLCFRGTPIIYYGDELGMPEYQIKKEELQDPFGKEYWPEYTGRDGCRTPFPWNNSAQAQGFSKSTTPWLPASSPESLDQQQNQPDSFFSLTQMMIRLRKQYSVFQTGTYKTVLINDEVYVFQRENQSQTIVIACNFTQNEQHIPLDNGKWEPLLLRGFDHSYVIIYSKLILPSYGFSILSLK